jgi:hypothetical protein
MKEHVDLALIQGGSVRAASEYRVGQDGVNGVGHFTMGQLYEELAFETQIAVVEVLHRGVLSE